MEGSWHARHQLRVKRRRVAYHCIIRSVQYWPFYPVVQADSAKGDASCHVINMHYCQMFVEHFSINDFFALACCRLYVGKSRQQAVAASIARRWVRWSFTIISQVGVDNGWVGFGVPCTNPYPALMQKVQRLVVTKEIHRYIDRQITPLIYLYSPFFSSH